jgi:catechol 2,3-dioxygenase-like lactoylglutathione lyase family enzyme
VSAALLSGLDHVVIVVNEAAPAASAYQSLLGREAASQRDADGVATALIVTDNIAVELMSPLGAGERAQRVRAALEQGGEGLKSLVFAASDIDRAHRRAERVGLDPGPIDSRAEEWRSFRVSADRTNGVRLFVMQRAPPLPTATMSEDGALGLDHIVIRTGEPERATALYGARLGLDMRLDREVMGRRLLFFRCGDCIVEIACDPRLNGQPDKLWGLSWRVANADRARARLAAAGFDVSDVRAGAKPGTRVFTVLGGTCGVPTLMIEPSPNRD